MFGSLNLALGGVHDAIFYILYALCVLATFVAVERLIYFWMARWPRHCGWTSPKKPSSA